MADKPSRALVLYAEGLARLVDNTHTHLHSLASKANCGFLSLPQAPASDIAEELSWICSAVREDGRVVRELACILDTVEAYMGSGMLDGSEASCRGSSAIPSLSERFMGMKVALVTNNSGLNSFGNQLGLSFMHLNGFSKGGQSYIEQPADLMVSELLKLLGFQEGKALEMSQFDLVLVHIGAGESVEGNANYACVDNLKFINSLVGSIIQVAQPRSDVGSHLHLSLLMSYGSVSDPRDHSFSTEASKEEWKPVFAELFPRQSYTMKGEQPRNDVRHHCPILIAQWQYAVTRKDLANTFSFKDFKENGGNLVIPADRFIHEVAFKLWKAPKYGA